MRRDERDEADGACHRHCDRREQRPCSRERELGSAESLDEVAAAKTSTLLHFPEHGIDGRVTPGDLFEEGRGATHEPVPLDEVLESPARLRTLGVTPLSFYDHETAEPSVIDWMPAAALYFRDPDGHLLEYVAMLDDEPDGEQGITSWSNWRDLRLQ